MRKSAEDVYQVDGDKLSKTFEQIDRLDSAFTAAKKWETENMRLISDFKYGWIKNLVGHPEFTRVAQEFKQHQNAISHELMTLEKLL